MTEVLRTFTCFGGPTTLAIDGDGPLGGALSAVEAVRDLMLDWHATFSRFKPESELCRLNADPESTVPVSPMMARFLQVLIDSAEHTGGLVDGTLIDDIEAAGYKQDRLRAAMSLTLALALTQQRQPGGPRKKPSWRQVALDPQGGSVTRPPGVRFDGGGLVKGLCADAAGEALAGYSSYVVDCDGDLRVGGTAGVERVVEVPNPFKGDPLYQFTLTDGGLSTCSIEKRSWLGEGMRPAHQLINPATGLPAFTGVVQVTARGSSALESEVAAKAAVLAGLADAANWLPLGGLVVLDDGSFGLVEEPDRQ
ncbi:MAG: FAD:protein FMN transferase [Actinomycetota bacterium]